VSTRHLKQTIGLTAIHYTGDVQPFVALGKRLKHHGHNVRIATHGTFKSFVKGAGLRFFNIGGDPEQLMSYMVRNPGLIPGFESLTNGDIGLKRKMVAEYLDGCWRACYEADEDEDQLSFAADAIISNPPAFAHIHCAEALGIPLQLSFSEC
jgi:sterol 3beta-glucosyltransferase